MFVYIDAGKGGGLLWEGSYGGAGSSGGHPTPVFAAGAPCHSAGAECALGGRSAPDFRVLVKPLALFFGSVVPAVVIAGCHAVLPSCLLPPGTGSAKPILLASAVPRQCNIAPPFSIHVPRLARGTVSAHQLRAFKSRRTHHPAGPLDVTPRDAPPPGSYGVEGQGSGSRPQGLRATGVTGETGCSRRARQRPAADIRIGSMSSRVQTSPGVAEGDWAGTVTGDLAGFRPTTYFDSGWT